jgi:hypothetical protein
MQSSKVCSEEKVVHRSLINVGDGAVRFCNENKIKLSTVNCIFFSSLSPHNFSGFPSVFLALSDLVYCFVHLLQ